MPETIKHLLARFGGANSNLLRRIFTPYYLRITSRSWNVFEADFPADAWTSTFEDGTTGKVIPREHIEEDAPWKEVVKARIRRVIDGRVHGELYQAGDERSALGEVRVGDYIEVDTFGATSKLESAICEAAFTERVRAEGFRVTRMPENVAKHVGTQNYYDFRLERDGQVYRVELKSLWGTDTSRARLIHTVSRTLGGKNTARSDQQVWHTSSCRFQDQDIFAVSLWLRTGRVTDFAFALSLPTSTAPVWGLPAVPEHPHHVSQNPVVSNPPTEAWTEDLSEICRRFDQAARGLQPQLEPVTPLWEIWPESEPQPFFEPSQVKSEATVYPWEALDE